MCFSIMSSLTSCFSHVELEGGALGFVFWKLAGPYGLPTETVFKCNALKCVCVCVCDARLGEDPFVRPTVVRPSARTAVFARGPVVKRRR